MNDNSSELPEWFFSGYPLATDPSRFGPFEDFVSLWRSRILTLNRIPSRSDLDFYDLKGWLGKISIAKITTDPFNVEFVLWGTELAGIWGVDYTRTTLGTKSVTPDAWRQTEVRYFEAMSADPFIGVVCGTLEQYNRPFVKVLGVDLPLTDGDNLTHVISAHLEIGLKSTVETTLPGLGEHRVY